MSMSARQRKGLVMLTKGVWVRQNAEGVNFCRVPRCQNPPESERRLHRGLCAKHFPIYPDGRPKCKQCERRFAVEPFADGLCEFCHPAYQETSPFEAHVLDEIRKGAPPTQAVQRALGPGTTVTAASRRLSHMSKSAKQVKRMKMAMEKAGITDDVIFAKLRQNIDATKKVYNGEGEVMDETPDVRASNQTIDMLFKLKGAYPSKSRKEEEPRQQTNIAVAVLPAVEPRKPDAQIYTLPQQTRRISSGGGDE